MKRILIFSLAYYPHVGGAEVAIKEITDRIEDIEFHMVSMRFSPSELSEEKIGNVVVHRVGKNNSYLSKILFAPRAAWMALRLDVRRFDALWAMMSYMVLPIALLRLMRIRIPYVLTLQDGDPFEQVFRRWYIRPVMPLLKSGFRNATIISVLSVYLSGWVRALGYTGDIVIVPNGVDFARFADATPIKIEKKEGTVVVITSSRLVHKNAVDDVIRALVLLPERVEFLILGTGSDEHMLKSLAQKNGVAGRAHFLGYISHTDLPGYLHASDIFVRPSRSEGFGASFPEAMAAGLPVIATQEGGIADFLFDAKRNPEKAATGWAVDTNNPEQIAQAVMDILENQEQTRKVIQNAREMVRKKYDWDFLARDMREKVFGRVFKNS